MKSMNLKKLFCVMLSTSILLPSGVGAKDIAGGNKSKWDSENVKRIAKKVAPYAAGIGIPVVAAVVVGAVALSKKSPKPSPKGDKPTDGDSSKDKGNGSNAGITTNNPGRGSVNTGVPSARGGTTLSGSTQRDGKFTREEINAYIEKGALPGLEFHVIFGGGKLERYRVFYKITNPDEAKKYLMSIDEKDSINTVHDWEMYIFYNDKAVGRVKRTSEIFGNESALSKDICAIIEKKAKDGVFDNAKRYCIQKDESKGGREKIVLKESPSDDEQRLTSDDQSNGQVSCNDGSVSAHKERKVVPASADSKTLTAAQILRSEINDSDGHVGDDAAGAAVERVNEDVDAEVSKGRLPGFQFYRCEKSKMGTYHGYIITDTQGAMTSLGIKGENDELWKKVLCYQNRWLFKKARFYSWAFNKIFGLDTGFGKKFDVITHGTDSQSREGTITFDENSKEYKSAELGGTIFAREVDSMENIPAKDDSHLMGIITKDKFDDPKDVIEAYEK